MYRAVVFDVFSRMIVGRSMGNDMGAELVDDALEMGVIRRKPAPALIPYLKSAVVFYVSFADDEQDWDFDFKKIGQITQNRIRTELMPVLRTGDPFELASAIDLVGDFLAEHVGETDDVRDYLKAFRGGEFRPELLFDDAAILERIASHPMVAWRLRESR